jgi:hypothetical protein
MDLRGNTRRRVQLIEHLERKFGLTKVQPGVLWGVFGTESNFGRNRGTSPAGARGDMQFMPQTAAGRGINPMHFSEAAKEAARMLSEFRGRGLAGMLGAYNAGPAGDIHNPETQAYIPQVMRYAREFHGLGGGGPQPSAAMPPVEAKASKGPEQEVSPLNLSRFFSTLSSLESRGNPYAPRGQENYRFFEALARRGEEAQESLRENRDVMQAAMRAHGGESEVSNGSQMISNGSKQGKVIVAPGADRAGVPTKRVVKNFVSLIAGSIGEPITIGTGTNHNQYTVDGNISDHWSGNAGDLPVPIDSPQGDMIAGRALMLLGVSRGQARQMAQQGGLFNITPRSGILKGRRVQVIWKTNQGGNHHNHVHVGIQ